MTIIFSDIEQLINDTLIDFLDLSKGVSLQFALGKLAAYSEIISLVTDADSLLWKDSMLANINEMAARMEEQEEGKQLALMQQIEESEYIL